MKPNSEKYQYLRHARRRFLAGTGCNSPERAVLNGERSIDEWSRIVLEERERQVNTAHRPPSAPPSKRLEGNSA